MKKLFVMLMAMTAIQAHAYSSGNSSRTKYLYDPETSGSSVHLTPTLGVAAMAVKSSSQSSGTDIGLSAGGLLEVGDSVVTFQTGLLFNQFGGSENSKRLALNYLSVPLLAKFNVNGSPEQTFFMRLGVMPGLLLSGSIREDNQSATVTNAKSFDLPFVLGIGASLPTSSDMSISFGLDYIRGLTSVAEKADIRNEGFLVSAGIVLPM